MSTTDWTTHVFKQTEDGPARLFQLVGRLLINKDLYKTMGASVTPKDGSTWCVLVGEKKVLGFAILEDLLPDGKAHLKYIYVIPGEEGKITAYRKLIKELIAGCEGLTLLWTVDHEDRTEKWVQLGFKKTQPKAGAWWYFERSMV